ncbi:L,D-transpeptidase family protein [Mesorhizobium sp. NBSH29]|uniref:L,D-transpeptidase family protein n=1 Tax=Mesorhizobium sp. NBSH29 TaxID=2654249 RepID=UPI0035BBA3C6
MLATVVRASLLVSALALTACTDNTLGGISSGSAKAEKPLPAKLVAKMKAKGMTRTSPVMARIFKEEGKVEVWKQKNNGRYDLIAEYDICKWSGKLGPKFTEGDRQAPEGFYTVRPAQLNPQSSFHLSFNMGFPNAYDRANGRTGAHLMVHGACSSAGCYSMTDPQIEEIYAFARDAFRGGQTEFQIEAFPFRMTPANMARYRNDPNYEFWKMLKEGYDHFEITKVPPKVDFCEKKYVFNQIVEPGTVFNPAGACPMTTQPDSLKTAYQSYQTSYEAAFSSATTSSVPPPKPTILGTKEAALVSEWTKKRARGERVPMEPPTLKPDGTVVVTSRMGRIDSPEGRKQAALDAAADAKRKAAEEKLAAEQRAKDEKAALAAAAADAKATPSTGAIAAPADTAPAAVAEQQPATLGGMRKKIGNLFGG